MISTKEEFEQVIAFELYVLETLYPAIEQKSSEYIDFREGMTNVTVGIALTSCVSQQAVDQLKNQLLPLLFGAAWKVLDILLEFALDHAGLSPQGSTWSIAEKQRHALNSGGSIAVLGCQRSVWATLLRVYAETVEHRHCLVHRTAKVDATSGTLEAIDRQKRPRNPLSREEQVALAKVAGIVARGAIQGGITRRSEEHLKYYLDVLSMHSNSPLFGIDRASVPVEIKLALSQESGSFFLDMNGVLEKARKTFAAQAHFDLTIDVPDGTRRRLFALAEACPLGRTRIDLDNLPPWLAYR